MTPFSPFLLFLPVFPSLHLSPHPRSRSSFLIDRSPCPGSFVPLVYPLPLLPWVYTGVQPPYFSFQAAYSNSFATFRRFVGHSYGRRARFVDQSSMRNERIFLHPSTNASPPPPPPPFFSYISSSIFQTIFTIPSLQLFALSFLYLLRGWWSSFFLPFR